MGYGDWRLPILKDITLLMAFFALREIKLQSMWNCNALHVHHSSFKIPKGERVGKENQFWVSSLIGREVEANKTYPSLVNGFGNKPKWDFKEKCKFLCNHIWKDQWRVTCMRWYLLTAKKRYDHMCFPNTWHMDWPQKGSWHDNVKLLFLLVF